MPEWQVTVGLSGDPPDASPDEGKRELIRLRWALRVAALVGLGLLELFHIVVLQRTAAEVLLDLMWGVLLSLGLIQICFSFVFRLYDRAVTDRQRLARQASRLGQLYAVSQRLLTSLGTATPRPMAPVDGNTEALHGAQETYDLNHSALSSALGELVDILGAEKASLLLFDEAGETYQYVHVGLPTDVGPGPQPDPGLTDVTPSTTLDTASWAAYLMPGEEGLESFLAAPVSTGERVMGYLALAGGELLSAQDRSILHTFSSNLGIILENTLLVQESRHKLTEAATLATLSQTISSKIAQEDLLPYLAENLVHILDATSSIVVLNHPHTGELAPITGFPVGMETGDLRVMNDGRFALADAVTRASQPIAVEDVHDNVYLSARKGERLEEKSLLGLPLVAQNQAIGAVIVGESRKRRRFSDGEIARAMVVANQGAVAIANARLFREVERRLVELGTLAEISRVIFPPLESPNIYEKVVDELARAFGYPFVAFYQVEKERLELGAQVGYDAGYLPAQVPWGVGLIGSAAATGQTGYVPDAGVASQDDVTISGVVAQIAMPVRKDGRVLGILCVESYDPLTEADLSLLQSLSYQVGTAIENSRLYSAEQREREVARTLLQIAGDLSGTLNLDDVLNLILERLKVVVPYDSAAIGMLAGDVCYVAAAHDLSRARRLWGTELSPDDLPLVAQVLSERTAVIVTDTRESADWVVTQGGEDIHSWLGVPLVVKDRTIGLLMLNHSEPGFYDQEASDLALAFAQHAALAIDNARLYEQIQSTLREQTLLHEMTTAASSTMDAGRVLRLLAERLVTTLGVTSARISTLLDEMHTANLVAEHHSADANQAERAPALTDVYDLAEFPVTTRMLTERQPFLITLDEAPAEWHDAMRQRLGQTMLVLPLVARDRVTGFAELWDSRSRRIFTEAEVALAQTLINPAAVAIDNARLFAETQRSISEMMLLYDIAVAAASSLDLDTILQSVVKTLQFRVLEKAVVNVWLLDAAEETLHLHAYAGEIEAYSGRDWLALDEDLCGQVVQTGQPILVRDCREDPQCADFTPVRSILCVPLAWGRRVVGVLQALSAQEGAFSSHDLRLLRTMAGSLAVAIENVRLFNQLRRSEEALVLRNQALERANDRLQELDRLKSAFIASVSHELRTPLNSIIGFSEVLLDGLAGDLKPLAHEYLGYIHDSGKHLLNLINDILDLSRIQAGRLNLTLEDVNILELVEEVRTTLAPMISKKQQNCLVEDAASPLIIVADRFRLKQILLNLLGNANKFTQDGGRITVRANLAEPTTLRLDVMDDGPGISLEDQTVIFEEFRQARMVRPGEGTGLGLAITRRLVELHGGRIWVESVLGAGACFTVLLPVYGPDGYVQHHLEEPERTKL